MFLTSLLGFLGGGGLLSMCTPRCVGTSLGEAKAFSPSPVRPLDGRVGLDPKGLSEHVC